MDYVVKSVRLNKDDYELFENQVKTLYGVIPMGIYSEFVQKCIQIAGNDIDFYKAILFNDFSLLK